MAWATNMRLMITAGVALLIIGCVNAPSETSVVPSIPDEDALALVELGARAGELARQRAAGATLLQIDTDLTKTSFRYGDGQTTNEIYVSVPTASTPSDQWVVRVDPIATPTRAMTLAGLRVGPSRVAAAMLAIWPECTGLGLTLSGEGDRLTWTVYCRVPEGIVNGKLDDRTGAFEATGLPAQPPPTASPLSQRP